MIALTLSVSNISTVLTFYDQIEVQRSTNFAFTSPTTITYINLIAGQTSYTYNDTAGNTSHWYRSRYYNTVTLMAGAWSAPVQGENIPYFEGASFPVECSYTVGEWNNINKVRMYLGDLKQVEREYVKNCYEDVMGDYYTYSLPNRGWPLKIIMTNASGTTEFTTLCNPLVQGYKYLYFTDVSNLIDRTTILDLWYSSFIYSDREIKEYYDMTSLPPGISSTAAGVEELLAICAAINLVETELQEFISEASVRVRDGDTEYDPTPSVRAREARLRFLKDKKKDLMDQIIKNLFLSIEGIRIE